MRRWLVVVAVVGLVAVAGATVAGASAGKGRVIHVIEHAASDAVTDTGAVGDSSGDILTFANEVFDKANHSVVGTDQGVCTRIVVGESWECIWTVTLPKGQITVEGPFYDTHDSDLAITGGTGAYATARGFMELRSRAGGTEYDFVYHLLG